MTVLRPLLAAVLCLALLPMAEAAETPSTKADVVRNAIDGYIRPAYADFATAAAEMASTQAAACKAPSPEALLAARNGFDGAITAFSRIEFVRFGPIMTDNRIEHILFWPDRRGIALRQVQALLAGKDESATVADGLRAKSVAVQGFNALEYVLFGIGAETLTGADGSFRCRYGAAVASGISVIVAEISAEWQAGDGIAFEMTHPDAKNAGYRIVDDSLQEITAIFIHGFEEIRDLRIRPAYGETIEKANPKAWLYQRSGLTATSLHADFAGLSELYDRSKLAGLLPDKDKWMEASIAFEFGNAGRAFQMITQPLPEAASDAAMRERVGYLLILTQSLQSLFADQLAPALGLDAGFSALDGD